MILQKFVTNLEIFKLFFSISLIKPEEGCYPLHCLGIEGWEGGEVVGVGDGAGDTTQGYYVAGLGIVEKRMGSEVFLRPSVDIDNREILRCCHIRQRRLGKVANSEQLFWGRECLLALAQLYDTHSEIIPNAWNALQHSSIGSIDVNSLTKAELFHS